MIKYKFSEPNLLIQHKMESWWLESRVTVGKHFSLWITENLHKFLFKNLFRTDIDCYNILHFEHYNVSHILISYSFIFESFQILINYNSMLNSLLNCLFSLLHGIIQSYKMVNPSILDLENVWIQCADCNFGSDSLLVNLELSYKMLANEIHG